jgi:hypothetical protein
VAFPARVPVPGTYTVIHRTVGRVEDRATVPPGATFVVASVTL